MADSIKQRVTFPSTPQAVYDALMQKSLHAKFSGAPARVSTKVGGAFSVYGGQISGINLELEPAKLIIQAWRAKNWPAQAWSIVTYRFEPAKGGKTKLIFSQTGIPPREHASIAKGWNDFYWAPLKKMLKG